MILLLLYRGVKSVFFLTRGKDKLSSVWTLRIKKLEGKVHPITGHEGPEDEQRYSSTLSWPRRLGGGGWSAPRPGPFTPGKDPVPIVQEAGWGPGPVWTGAENLAPTGIRHQDHPACSESLYHRAIPVPFENG